MTLLWQDGFDAYGTANQNVVSELEQAGYVFNDGGSGAAPSERADNGTGFGLSLSVMGAVAIYSELQRYFPIRAGIVAGFRVKCNSPTLEPLCSIGYNNLIGTITDQIVVYSNGANGITVQTGDGTTIWTSDPNVFFQGVWQYLQVKYIPDPSNGTVIIKIDDDAVIYVTTGKTTTGALGGYCNYLAFKSNGLDKVLVDDFYLCDLLDTSFNDFLGDVVVHDILPNADAGTNQFAQTGGGTGHYTSIDDVPPDGDTSYLSSNTSGDKEQFTLSTFPVDIVDVLAVAVNITARKSNAGAATYQADMVVGGVEGLGTVLYPSTAYIQTQSLWLAPPSGGAWTLSEAQNAVIGVKLP